MSVFVRPRRLDHPALRFVVFHHAGGSGVSYFPLNRTLPADWELLLLDLPGRGKRVGQPLVADVETLVSDTVGHLAALTDRPLALFGHSLGAILASEVGRALTARGTPPVWLGVSGRVPPSSPLAAGSTLHQLDDARLLDVLLGMGALPAQIVEHEELRTRLLRVARADLTAVGSYVPATGRPSIGCALDVFGGTDDPWAPTESLAGWGDETDGPFGQHLFTGGHFYFMDDGFGSIARRIAARPVLKEVSSLAAR